MKRAVRGPFGILALVVAVACTEPASGGTAEGESEGERGEGEGEGEGGLDAFLEEAVETFAEAACRLGEICRSAAARLFPLQTEKECRARLLAALEDEGRPRLQAAVERGTLRYHPEHAEDCLDEIAAAGRGPDCGEGDRAQACDRALAGTVAAGGECFIATECEGELFCDVGAGECPGRCAERRGQGDRCGEDAPCARGLACLGEEEDERCETEAGEGEPCRENGCAGILYCLGADDEEGRPGECTLPDGLFTAREGEECGGLEAPFCREGLHCAIVDVSVLGARWECVSPAAAGGACRFAAPFHCPRAQACVGIDLRTGDLDGDCEPLPGEGEPCLDEDVSFVRCAPPLVCDEVAGDCVAFGRIGDDCRGDDACASGRCRDGRCGAPEPCELPEEA